MREFPLLIEGKDEGGTVRDIRSPWDDSVVGRVAFAGAREREAAVRAAVAATPAMRGTPSHERARILAGIARGIEARKDEIAATIRDEAGKPIRFASAEVGRAADTFALAAEEARRLAGETVAIDGCAGGEGRFGIVRRLPVGPVLAVSPFNFPLNLAAHKVAPAIAAGCPCVLKPSSQTPMSAHILGEIAREAGLPPGALTVLPAPRAVADPLVEDDRFRLLTFTGSPEVGWAMKARAGRKKVVLELGGNAAAIVGPGADLEWAVPRLATGAFAYAGQVCISVQRIYCLPEVHAAFAERFAAYVSASVATGDPADPATVVGPMIDDANADRICGWIAEAVARGSRTIVRGARNGRLVGPAVLAGVEPDLSVAAREAFGPVVIVERVEGWDDAIARTNASVYGLQAGVFTNDLRGLWRCFEEIEVGAVIHNDYPTFRTDAMPYGGVKESGLGREGPRYAIEEMTEPRLLVVYPR